MDHDIFYAAGGAALLSDNGRVRLSDLYDVIHTLYFVKIDVRIDKRIPIKITKRSATQRDFQSAGVGRHFQEIDLGI